MNSTTNNSTPPPGARRSTLGTNPLYSAPIPSSLAIKAKEGYVQLYLGAAPAIFGALWIRDLTTLVSVSNFEREKERSEIVHRTCDKKNEWEKRDKHR